MVLIIYLSCERILLYSDFGTLFLVVYSHWVYSIYSLPLTDIVFRYRGDIEHIMMPIVYVQSQLQVVTIGCLNVCMLCRWHPS